MPEPTRSASPQPSKATLRTSAAAAALVALLLVAGCATTPPAFVDVEMTPNGLIHVEGEPVTSATLVAAVRNQGAQPDTVIEITVPKDTDSADLVALSAPLTSAGFKRVVFKKPRQANASIKSTP